MLAEAVGRAPLADQLRTRFFVPLGLDHTWYQSAEAPRGPVAHGYRFTGKGLKLPAIDLSDGSPVVPFTSVITASGGAGSIATSASDLARWAAALYGGNVLSDGSRAAMIEDIARTARLKPAIPYGLGVQGIPVVGRSALGHSGRFLGSRAVMRWLPAERMAIAVVTNQSRTDPAAAPGRSCRARPHAAAVAAWPVRRPDAVHPGTRRPGRPVPAPAVTGTDGSWRTARRGSDSGHAGDDEDGDPCRCVYQPGHGERRAGQAWLVA